MPKLKAQSRKTRVRVGACVSGTEGNLVTTILVLVSMRTFSFSISFRVDPLLQVSGRTESTIRVVVANKLS